MTIFPRQTMQLSALVTDDRGLVLPGRPMTYTSSNPQSGNRVSHGTRDGRRHRLGDHHRDQ